MTDTVLVIDGCAEQVWRNTTIAELYDVDPTGLVEANNGTVFPGMLYDGVEWTVPPMPEPEKRRVEKWLIIKRVDAAGKGAEAMALLMMPGNELAFFEWMAPIPAVYFDDAKTVAMIAALGLDPEVVMREGEEI